MEREKSDRQVSSMRVLNFGSLNLDYVYNVDHFVRPGETLAASSRAVKAGGKGLNQSVALARAGVPVCHAGCLGAGGEMLKIMLEENGVDTESLLPVPEAQGHTVIQVDRDGANCILLFGGSNRCVPPSTRRWRKLTSPCWTGCWSTKSKRNSFTVKPNRTWSGKNCMNGIRGYPCSSPWAAAAAPLTAFRAAALKHAGRMPSG